jgi:hypothetical protein
VLKNKSMENMQEKSKSDLLKEMQIIAEDIERYKFEVEKLLQIIDSLEIKYYEIASQIKQN